MDRKNKGVIVTAAAIGVNLAAGFPYAWSVYAATLVKDLGFTKTEAMLPYTFVLTLLALMTVPGGKLFDKFGPRLTATLGGILVVIGISTSAYVQSVTGFVVAFGILAGAGSGLAYGCTIPSANKWFPPAKRGLVSGLVVAGLGLAAVYQAPLTQMIIYSVGIKQTFLIEGILFGGLMVLFAQFLAVPPADWVAPGTLPVAAGASSKKEYAPSEMLKTKQFYLMWLTFCFGSVAGLMVIGNIAIIAKIQANLAWGFALVAILAIFNSAGRVLGGILSDRIGRNWTLTLMFVIQAVNMLAFKNYTSMNSLTIGVCLIGITFGANFGIFPALTYDYFGMKNSGLNYGCVFTAFGAAGIIGPMLGGKIVDITQSYDYAYMTAAAMLVIGLILAQILKPPASIERTPKL